MEHIINFDPEMFVSSFSKEEFATEIVEKILIDPVFSVFRCGGHLNQTDYSYLRQRFEDIGAPKNMDSLLMANLAYKLTARASQLA